MFEKLTEQAELSVHKEQLHSLERELKNIQNNQEAFTLLCNAGLEQAETISDITLQCGRYYDVMAKDLPKYRKVLGKLTGNYKYLTVDGKIMVQLHPQKYPNIKLRYEGHLTNASKCKIVEQTTTQKKLVCDPNAK